MSAQGNKMEERDNNKSGGKTPDNKGNGNKGKRRKPGNGHMGKGGRRDNDRDDGKFDSRDIPSTNDPSWYGTYPELQKDAGSFSFSWPTGMPLRLNGPFTARHYATDSVTTPGVLSLDLMHTVGNSSDGVSALNVAARNIYSFVRHANSGHTNYDAPDLMKYIVCMNEVYSIYSWLRRLYGVTRLYSTTNRYYPVTVVRAMGVDFDDIQTHLADLRYYVNQLAIKLSTMAVPASMPYTARRLWLYSNIYTDATASKSQIYLMNPVQVLKFGTPDVTTGKQDLVPTIFVQPGAYMTFDAITHFVDSLFDPIYASEDMNIMSGDILKAFGDNGIVKFVSVPEDYVQLPIYDPNVLSQIENARCVSYGRTDRANKSFQVTELTGIGKGWLISEPYMNKTTGSQAAPYKSVFEGDALINFHTTDTNPGLVFEGTRLTLMSDGTVANVMTDGTTPQDALKIFCGTEVVREFMIYYNDYDIMGGEGNAVWDLHAYRLTTQMHENAMDSKTAFLMAQGASLLSKFDWHPTYVFSVGSNASNFWMTDPNVDLDVWTVMNLHDLQKLNDAAALSLWNTPLVGRATSYKG